MAWKSAGQRILRWSLWVLVGWVFLRGLVSLLPATPAESAPPQAAADVRTQEPAGLRAFPAMFARDYLTWEKGNPAERAERLRPYLAGTLDRQAGWSGTEAASQQVEQTWVYSVKEVSASRWLVTVAARTPARTLFLAVPVSRTASGGWVVYDYPALVPPPAAAEFTEPAYFGQERTDQGDRVKTLLTTFFKAYFEGGDVTYLLAPGSSMPTLKGGWSFGSVGKVALLSAGEGTWAVADVSAVDRSTGAQFTYRYMFRLTERDGRWYITEMQQKGD